MLQPVKLDVVNTQLGSDEPTQWEDWQEKSPDVTKSGWTQHRPEKSKQSGAKEWIDLGGNER